jgi:hypothetical protein
MTDQLDDHLEYLRDIDPEVATALGYDDYAEFVLHDDEEEAYDRDTN